MSYTRPDFDAADASWVGAVAYTRPDYDAADASWEPTSFEGAGAVTLADPSVSATGAHGVSGTGASTPDGLDSSGSGTHINNVVEGDGAVTIPDPSVEAEGQHSIGAVGSVIIGAPTAVGIGAHGVAGVVALTMPDLAAVASGSHSFAAVISLTGPLGPVKLLTLYDFTSVIGETVTRYVVDLVTPDGNVRAPISSWQATLQTGSSNYVQCVIPGVSSLVSTVNAATEFVIYRVAELPDGSDFVYEMARAPIGDARFDQGPERHTCTLSGYSTAFADAETMESATDRALKKVRSISTNAGGSRIRCAVDWLLRPGRRALLDGYPITASYINYYVGQNDAYMDVGERLTV